MNNRTTIGGTVYESVGSSSSNLLLKCNGTARIQWGNKLIDLIKNGKLATSGDSSIKIDVVTKKSDIKGDGIYVLESDQYQQLFIKIKGNLYNLTGTELYISTNNKQEITVELQKLALENIGMYYNTLEELQNSGIQDGLAYVLENTTLYTISNGIINEFEAKLKTITVEKEELEGNVINSSVQIVLSVNNMPYIVLKNNSIVLHRSLELTNNNTIHSLNATNEQGFILGMRGNTSYLEIDELIVRNDSNVNIYNNVTFSELTNLIYNNKLKIGLYYILTDFLNHWKLPARSSTYNRPLLLSALNTSLLSQEGVLFNDKSVKIHYDFYFLDSFTYQIVDEEPFECKARGKITWMCDSNNNEANFDFLDYIDHNGLNFKESLTYKTDNGISIFPLGSHDNKLTINDLYGVSIYDKQLSGTTSVYLDIQENYMYNNIIVCDGVYIKCNYFYDNTLTIHNSNIYSNLINCYFKLLSNSPIEGGDLLNITCYTNIVRHPISPDYDYQLYEHSSNKEVYLILNILKVYSHEYSLFPKGMITMYSGSSEIPANWAMCDGTTNFVLNSLRYNKWSQEIIIENETTTINWILGWQPDMLHYYAPCYINMTSFHDVPHFLILEDDWLGEEITPPNLIGKFIKASNTSGTTGGSNTVTLTEKNLPEHSHPHNSHTHTLSGITGTILNSNSLSVTLSNSNYIKSVTPSTTAVVEDIKGSGFNVLSGISTTNQGGTATGGIHDHTITISGGTADSTTSTEQSKTWSNNSFDVQPEYYSLIFIMKL